MSGKDEILTIRIEKEWKERLKRIVQELSKRQLEGKFSLASIAEAAIKTRIMELEKELGITGGTSGDKSDD